MASGARPGARSRGTVLKRQHRGAEHAGLLGEVGLHDARMVACRAERPLGHHLAGRPQQQLTRPHHATADHDHLGVERVHQAHQPGSEV